MCVDRTDHTAYFWPAGKADDGISYYDGQPGRSLLWGYQETISKMQAMLVGHNQAAFSSSTNPRIDMLRNFDGIYDEFGDDMDKTALDSILALRKPAAAWDHGTAHMPHDGPQSREAFLQRLLYVGMVPTVPSDWGDHTLTVGSMGWLPRNPNKNMHFGWNSSELLQLHLDYAPLFAQLKNKRWLLRAHAVTVNDTLLWWNAFEVHSGLMIPVIRGLPYGPGGSTVEVTTRNLPIEVTRAHVLYPGGAVTRAQTTQLKQSTVYSFPLRRGCGVLLLEPSTMTTHGIGHHLHLGSVTMFQLLL